MFSRHGGAVGTPSAAALVSFLQQRIEAVGRPKQQQVADCRGHSPQANLVLALCLLAKGNDGVRKLDSLLELSWHGVSRARFHALFLPASFGSLLSFIFSRSVCFSSFLTSSGTVQDLLRLSGSRMPHSFHRLSMPAGINPEDICLLNLFPPQGSWKSGCTSAC